MPWMSHDSGQLLFGAHQLEIDYNSDWRHMIISWKQTTNLMGSTAGNRPHFLLAAHKLEIDHNSDRRHISWKQTTTVDTSDWQHISCHGHRPKLWLAVHKLHYLEIDTTQWQNISLNRPQIWLRHISYKRATALAGGTPASNRVRLRFAWNRRRPLTTLISRTSAGNRQLLWMSIRCKHTTPLLGSTLAGNIPKLWLTAYL